MSMLLLILLATALAQHEAQVPLDSEGWVVETKSAAVHSRWQWSARCAPQKIEASGAAAECPPSRELRVRVVDAKGRPAPHSMLAWATDAMLRDLPDPELPAIATSDEGRAVFGVAAADIWIRVTGPQLGTSWRRVARGESDIRLQAGPLVPLRIVLRGEDGEPVRRARIVLLPSSCAHICPERLMIFDSGKEPMRIAGVAGSSHRLVVWSDSHAPLTRTVAFSSAADLTLTPERGSSIRARIVDRQRKPARNARLDVHFQLPGLQQAIRRSAVPASDGLVMLSGLPLAPVEWTASGPGAARRTEQLSLSAAAADLGDVVLQPSRRAVVRVVDAADVAVPEARVVVRGNGFAVTDAKGTATFEELPQGEVELDVTAEGFLPAQSTFAGDAPDLTVRMDRGAGIKAVLVREDGGRAAQNVRVRITNNGSESLRTLEGGDELSVSGLRTGGVRLRISVDGSRPYDSGALTVVEGQVLDLGMIVLEKGSSIRGVVADATGAPVRDARVRALQTGGDAPALAHVLGNWSEVTSGDDGAFHISGLMPGPQFLTIDASGFPQRAITNLSIDGSGSELDLGTVELDRGTRLELVCRPVAQCGSEASVLAAGPDFPFVAVHSPLVDGRASFPAAPPGTVTLRLARAKHIVHERTIEVRAGSEATTVEIELASLRLRGEVVLGTARAGEGSLLFTRSVRTSGVPILTRSQTPQGSTVGTEWLGSFGAATYAAVDSRGAFAVDGIAPGEYEVVFRAGSGSTAPVRLNLPDVREHNLRLQFDARELAGSVRDANDRAVLARVEVVDGAGATHVTSSGSDGRFRLLGVSAGRAAIKATANGRRAEATVDAADQAARQMVLRLLDEDRSGLSVTVHEFRGHPAAGVLVFMTERGGLRAASTDGEGRAVFRSVEGSGSFAIAVHRPGAEWAFGNVQAGSPSRIVLPENGGSVVAQSHGMSGFASIITPSGFPLDQVLPMVGISTHLGTAGTLRLTGLPAGSYAFRVGMQQKVAMVSGGETTTLRFEP